MKNAIVFGGAGFIGYYLSSRLARDEVRVTICDNLSRGKLDIELAALLQKKNVTFLELDLASPEQVAAVDFSSYDSVFHLAAVNGTKYFYEKPHEVLRVNLLSLLNVLDALGRSGYAGKLVWTSSSETYAGGYSLGAVPIPTPESVPLVVNDIYNPRFSYAASKIAGESLALNYSRTFGLDVTIIRPHNIYGPRMHQEHVIPEFCLRAVRREDPFTVYGGAETRAFCYVDDFVDGIVAAAGYHGERSEIVNLGNDSEEIDIETLARRTIAVAGYDAALDIKPAAAGSVKRRCPDISKARRLLGFEPRVSLEEGLRMTYDWYARSLA